MFAHFSRRMVFIAPSSPASTDSDTESVGKMQLILPPRRSVMNIRKAARAGLLRLLLAAGCFGVWTPERELRRALKALVKAVCHLVQERITELILIEVTDLKTKRSSGIRICEEQQEQSQKQQEDHTPPGKADSYISQVEASPLSRPRPPLSLPLASEARPSSSRVSHPSQGTSDQMQDTPDRAPELSFPFAPSSSHTFRTKGLADMAIKSNISGGACLPKTMNLLEEEGLGGHDQLYDSAVRHLISGINGIGELKRRYDLRAGEQANRLKEMEDTAIMLRKQVEELEAKVSMANMSERRLMDILSISEDRHARTEKELALVREKMDEADCRIEYLEAAVSRYQNRIAVAEVEKEKAEERACGASVGGESMSTPRPSPAAPRSTSLSFVPAPSPRLTDSEVCKESALFPALSYY